MQGACRFHFRHLNYTRVESVQERGLKANLKTEAMIELLLDPPPFVFPPICFVGSVHLILTPPARNLAAHRAIEPRLPGASVDNHQPGHVYIRRALSLYIQIRMRMRATMPSNRSPKFRRLLIPVPRRGRGKLGMRSYDWALDVPQLPGEAVPGW
jgi:hypothetical protein